MLPICVHSIPLFAALTKSTFKLQIVCILIEKRRRRRRTESLVYRMDREGEMRYNNGRFWSFSVCFIVLPVVHSGTWTRWQLLSSHIPARMQFAALLCNKKWRTTTKIFRRINVRHLRNAAEAWARSNWA